MGKLGPEFDDVQKELTLRLRVLGEMFTDLANAKDAGLLESLLSYDPAEFHQILDRYDLPAFPLQGTCVWVRQVIDTVLVTPDVDQYCTLRTDLTPAEKAAVVSIAARNFVLFLAGSIGGEYIAPGPLLDELKARGFVTCEEKLRNSKPFSLLGPYEQHCL